MLARFLSAPLLFLVVLAAQTEGAIVTYTNCVSPHVGVGEVVEVDVTPCDPYGNGGCILYKNATVDITIKFKPNANSETLIHKVHGIIWNMAAVYNRLGTSNACPKITPSCGLVQGQEYTYANTFTVLLNYPSIPVQVRWQLLTANNVIQVCILIPVKIAPPKST